MSEQAGRVAGEATGSGQGAAGARQEPAGAAAAGERQETAEAAAGEDAAALLARARDVRARAHAPYSGFAVGAALRVADGRVFAGVNVENASAPVGICAERAALAAAVTAGALPAVCLAVAGPGPAPCLPCGMCRQALHELAPDLQVIAGGAEGAPVVYPLRELLPHPFTL